MTPAGVGALNGSATGSELSRPNVFAAASQPCGMSDWDLDLRDAEEQMDEAFAAAGDVVLGVLDGTTDPDEWVRSIDYGNTLVCCPSTATSTNSPRGSHARSRIWAAS